MTISYMIIIRHKGSFTKYARNSKNNFIVHVITDSY